MAEAAAVPLSIAGAQAGWSLIQKLRQSRPAHRLRMCEEKINIAMRQVQIQVENSRVNPKEIEVLMEHHTVWERNAGNFKAGLEKKKMGVLNWKAWFGQKAMWTEGEKLWRFAEKTSSGAVISYLTCEAYHRGDQADTCYICACKLKSQAGQNSTGASTSIPQADLESVPSNGIQPEQGPISDTPVTRSRRRKATPPTVNVTVRIESWPTGAQPEGFMPIRACVLNSDGDDGRQSTNVS